MQHRAPARAHAVDSTDPPPLSLLPTSTSIFRQFLTGIFGILAFFITQLCTVQQLLVSSFVIVYRLPTFFLRDRAPRAPIKCFVLVRHHNINFDLGISKGGESSNPLIEKSVYRNPLVFWWIARLEILLPLGWRTSYR